MSLSGSIEGLGTKRIFGIHIGMNQNPSKSSKLISFIWLINWYCLILCSHSSSSSLPSYTIPLIGISIAERLRDRGFDTIIRFDDSSKHSKSYRQISLILAKIPSRDASPSDISNIHASISERCGKLKLCYFNGSITASPIIETIANDITEYTATNIIPITDRQSYTNKKLFLDSCRPSIDSALSVSRIGSNAQCKSIKIISVGSKNEPTNYRIMELSSNSFDFFKLLSLNQIFFQDHLYITSINLICILIILYRNGIFFNKAIKIKRLIFLLSCDYFYFYYIIFLVKSSYSILLYYYLLVIYLVFILFIFFNYSFIKIIILLGFRYSASSIPSISSAGVAIGVGSIPSILIFAICRNPIISNVLIRWALIGSSLVEVSGSIGSVYSLLIPYAFIWFIIN